MNRKLLVLSVLAGALVLTQISPAEAGGGRGCGFGHGGGCGIGGIGFGIGGYNDICGYAELYRELYNNLPYFALHPPVYYSYPVPRTYGYSPFAYPPGVMTPEFVGEVQPLTIENPYVPKANAATPAADAKSSDRSANVIKQVEPLVVINPFVAGRGAIAQSER
jgi:hypothetical protein